MEPLQTAAQNPRLLFLSTQLITSTEKPLMPIKTLLILSSPYTIQIIVQANPISNIL